MVKIVLILLWPFLRRYLLDRAAEQIAGFLNRRREQRSRTNQEPTRISPAELVQCPSCPPTQVGYSSSDIFWFTMSGVLLGSAVGVLLSYLTRQEE